MKELTLNEMEYISGGFNLFGAASGLPALSPTLASASPLCSDLRHRICLLRRRQRDGVWFLPDRTVKLGNLCDRRKGKLGSFVNTAGNSWNTFVNNAASDWNTFLTKASAKRRLS